MAANSSKEKSTTHQDSILLGYNLEVDKSRSAVSAIGVGRDNFDKALDIDVHNSLYGKIAGLSVSQGGGLMIHGRAPLVLVDGFPRLISDVTSSEIESITVLKDAVSAAIYGVRGGNGVVMIQTKRAGVQPLKVSVDYQFGIKNQFRVPEFADAYTYATNLNSALDFDGLSPKYNELELEAFKNNTYPYEYPNVDWWNEVYNKTATNHRLRMNFSGGNQAFKYYTTMDYLHDESFFKSQSEDERYDSSPTDLRLRVRSNMDIAITPTTQLAIGVMAEMRETNGSYTSASSISEMVYNTPSAAFPIKYRDGVYGGNAVYQANNPVAKLFSTGNNKWTYFGMLSNFNLNQDLSAWLEGLSADASVAFDYNGFMSDNSSKEYRYVDSSPTILPDGTMVTTPTYFGKDSEVLGHGTAFQNLELFSHLQTKVNYEYNQGYHDVRASVIYNQDALKKGGRNQSIRRQSMILYANYAYNGRYIIGASTSYSGSAYLEPGSQFDIYPAVNAAWVVSQEEFMRNVDLISNLRVFASYGTAGLDHGLSHELWRQSYGSEGAIGYAFSVNSGSAGKAEGDVPVENLSAEKITKKTVGVELGLLEDRLNIYAEAFHENRDKILMDASTSVSGVLGIGVSQLNMGEYEYKGADFSIQWNDRIGDFTYSLYTNASYLTTEIIQDNQAFQRYDYLYQRGNEVGQAYGLEALGFFEDQMDINNSPVHTFQVVAPGDLKYKDQNGDNKIDAEDVVKMHDSWLPELYYGFGFNVGYKGFELSADFQGATGLTVNTLSIPLYQPLMDNGNISQTVLDNEIFWTPETHDIATMPRLTTLDNKNNYRNSSHWYKDGSFLKLRSLYIAYTIPKEVIKFASAKVYVQGNNLFSIDNLDIVDPEQLGAMTPMSKVYYMGVKFNF